MDQTGDKIELPRYQCHKKVWALKIESIEADSDTEGATIYPENKEYMPLEVSKEYVQKHNPQAGGYYIQYKDGYKSYSPAKAFEEGYTLINY